MRSHPLTPSSFPRRREFSSYYSQSAKLILAIKDFDPAEGTLCQAVDCHQTVYRVHQPEFPDPMPFVDSPLADVVSRCGRGGEYLDDEIRGTLAAPIIVPGGVADHRQIGFHNVGDFGFLLSGLRQPEFQQFSVKIRQGPSRCEFSHLNLIISPFAYLEKGIFNSHENPLEQRF